MATKNSKLKRRDRVWVRQNKNGSTTFLGVVRVKPFKLVSKAFTTRQDAKNWAKDLVEELGGKNRAGERDTNFAARTIRELVEKFLADIRIKGDGTSDYPQQPWYPDLTRLLAWWTSHYGSTKVREFGEDQITEARDSLCRGRKPATVNRHLAAMRRCWNKGQKNPLPWPKDILLTEPNERARFLDDDELKATLGAAAKHSPWMHAAVVTSIATGLRQGELLRLEWKDIDLVKQTVTVHISKSGKKRLVHLPSPAVDALKKARVVGPKLVFLRPDGEPIDKSFLNVHWKRVRMAAGLKDFRWHDLRHSCASYLAQAGASLLEIGSVLGHSSPSVTMRYSHMVAGRAVTGADKLAEKLGAKL